MYSTKYLRFLLERQSFFVSGQARAAQVVKSIQDFGTKMRMYSETA